ncbi:MAG: HIT domain-containing protein [Candidatus Pacebacteria bacterium]|nr:HIT domain-containing protein [Candidatus Paceibacterota bacterium]
MSNCIFCNIIKKEAPAQITFENDLVLAILPLDQVSKGHTLVIPRNHFENIFDVDDSVLREVISVTKELSCHLLNETGATGVNILNASGKDAQQSVNHLHFHVVPRFPNDGLDMWIKQGL